MSLSHTLNYEKITQILNFFASKAGGIINRMKALKLMYLADRYHLRKYGRLVSNDKYFAMKLGPVPSLAADIAENDECMDSVISIHAREYVRPTDKYTFQSIKPVECDVFSETDIEALEFSWEHFGNLNQWDASDFTHHYPEWKKHEKKIKGGCKTIAMSLYDFFGEPDVDINTCYELNEEEKEIRRELLAEAEHIESLWR